MNNNEEVEVGLHKIPQYVKIYQEFCVFLRLLRELSRHSPTTNTISTLRNTNGTLTAITENY
jgi:hypothetical protein